MLNHHAPIVKWSLAIIWLLTSFYLFTLPGTAFPQEDWFDKYQVDKLVHIVIFFLLCLLFFRAMLTLKGSYTSRSLAVYITLIAIVYGVLIEFIQKYYIPHRSFDMGDIVADIIGCLIALYYCLNKVST